MQSRQNFVLNRDDETGIGDNGQGLEPKFQKLTRKAIPAKLAELASTSINLEQDPDEFCGTHIETKWGDLNGRARNTPTLK